MISSITFQKLTRFAKHQAAAKRGAKVYTQYSERALQLANAVITKNNYSAASFAGRQVVMTRST